MLENPSIDPSVAAAVPVVKRYAPPNQRNRSLGRRKSGGGGLERANGYGNDVEKNQVFASKTAPTVNQGDWGRSQRNENSPGQLISLVGCCNSEAFQLLNDRWAAAMHEYTILPADSSERPVLYSRRSASPWGRAVLPRTKDFLSELRNAIRNSPGNAVVKH